MKTFIICLGYPLLALLDLSFTWFVAAPFANWWAPLLARQVEFSDRGRSFTGYKLPRWLTWLDTFDADLDQGARDGSINSRSVYWSRVQWLYRNCAYGFSYLVIGAAFRPSSWRVVIYEQTAIRFTFVAISDTGHFNLHAIRFGLRFKLGWKAWNYFIAETGEWNNAPWGPQWRVPFVFSISRA